jgi:iron complex outermembrane recepter protein
MKNILLTFAFFLLIIRALIAQDLTIRGTITAVEDGLPLIGVTVQIKGTLIGAVTDFDGKFSISGAKPESVLVISFVGYETLEIPIDGKTVINVKLKESAKELEEVVVTALGISRQKREIGYSTEKVESSVIVDSKAPNVLNALSGRSAGVQISQSDGVDGGSTRIVIRGNNNIGTDNQPLIVVDNIPMENIPGLTNIGRGVDWGSVINDLNAYDIENMTLMKGGAASALYGSRGANGVLFITTKRGNKQKGIGITYNVDYKSTNPYRYREVQNVYGHGGPISFTPPTFPRSGDTLLYPGIYGNENLIINQQGETSSTSAEFGYYGSAVSWGPKMDGQMVKWWDGKMRAWSPQPDNLKIPYQNGYTITHNVSATGGNEKGTMRVSLTRQDNKPIVDNSNFNRTTINLGANLNISEKLKTDVTVSFINFQRLNSPMLGEDANSFNKGLLYSWPRSYQGIDKQHYQNADGSQNPQEGYPFYYVSPTLWWGYYNNNTTLNRDKYTAALTLTYDIAPGISAQGRVGRDFTIEQFETRNKPIDVIGLQDGYYSNGLSRNIGDNYDFTVTAFKDKVLNTLFDVRFTAGASRWNQDYYFINGHSGTWYYPNMYTFFNYTDNIFSTDANNNTIVDQLGNSAGSMIPGEGILRKRNNSVYSFLNLSYANYLFLELTGRNDWSSTLPAGANSYFYPSLSLSFIPSEVFNFEERIPWLNFMKIRGGLAQTATDTEPYLLSFYYNTGRFGGQQTSNFPSTIPPILLKPQRVNAYETGVNFGFFDNRIDLDFTYYYLYSFDQIIPNLPIPTSSGASNIMTNEGVLTNRGFEIILNTVPVRSKHLTIRSGLNFARNRNKVVSLGSDADTYLLADIWGLNGPAMVLEAGDDFGTISGYDYIYDDNGNRVLNAEGTKYLITDSRVPIGNASPDFIAGWNAMLTYKGFKLSTLIDTKWGGDIYSGSYVISLQTGQSPETLIEREGGGLPYTDPAGNTSNIGVILPGVHEDGTPNTTVVHYYYKYLPNAGGWGKFVSTPGILENTWVKMREISMSYTLPKKITDKTKVFQNLTLSVTGRDLFYIYTTLPDNINPEGIMGAGNAQGFEWASYPGARSVVFGLSAGF